MAKKITANFKDKFKDGEFERLTEQVVAAVGRGFPCVIVHTYNEHDLWDDLVVHAFGYPLDEVDAVEQDALQAVWDAWNSGLWRLERQPISDRNVLDTSILEVDNSSHADERLSCERTSTSG
jgi:predicted metal-dependent phosphoesterase TrpH